MTLVRSALDVDGVWTSGQVERWGLEVPPSALVVEGYLGLTHYRKSRPVRFFVSESLAHLPLTTLRHLAGVAEMRILLGVEADPAHWRVFHRQIHPVEEPDAVWFTPSGPVAVEYDVGSYSRERVRAKAAAFALRYVGQVWGTPIPERLRTLASLLPPGTRVLVASWA
ncbi:replication-relaxation family protein [Thermus sp. NEB1569]|uniref:replication-relaxation family protein n=1 Tax=Thermus sp. NEB1569 TaxID=2918899 RepID=UPI001EFAF84E|nr:replication-relaxation family protein [Thermus sp. NEB1569]ULR39728.1 hypothetical protein MI302_00195 [Thermus sp. NEB1569]